MLDPKTERGETVTSRATHISIARIVSGGQTGVDRAALDWALSRGLPCGGYCPKGRLSEDGAIPLHYPLTETKTKSYPERTELNIRESDGTLILRFGPATGGTKLTISIAQRLNKPFFEHDLLSSEVDTGGFHRWVARNRIVVLNVAGPRESHAPGRISAMTEAVLSKLFLS